jgi:non-heme chloroperoxidase
MRKIILYIAVLTMCVTTLQAQDIAGDWQGTLSKADKHLRIILHFEKGADGAWTGKLYSIDQAPDPIPVSAVTLHGSALKLTVDWVRGSYEGKVNADGVSITGTWTQADTLPLDFRRATKETAWQRDKSPHTVQFITVDAGVKLEVLDWGGSGRPVVLLAGLGNTAHVFDDFAPKLVPAHHVYGITRRGFGESSVPASGYSADRLGDDVLAVIHALKLDRPVLAGHSIAGEELSSIGTRHPETVAGLIYLDAAYGYAYYDHARGDFQIDKVELQKSLERLQPGKSLRSQRQVLEQQLQSVLQFEKSLREALKDLQAGPPEPEAGLPSPPMPAPALAIIAGKQKYADIRVPILAIYAVPHAEPGLSNDPATRAAEDARDLETTGAQARAFETGEPSARVVRLPHASHFVFESNEADVLREVNTFLNGLP